MPPISTEAENYTIFGHSLHSIQQASICLSEDMPSQGTPYPGATDKPIEYFISIQTLTKLYIQKLVFLLSVIKRLAILQTFMISVSISKA